MSGMLSAPMLAAAVLVTPAGLQAAVLTLGMVGVVVCVQLREGRVAVEDVGEWSQPHGSMVSNDSQGRLEFVAVDGMGAGERPHIGEVAPARVHGPALKRGDHLLCVDHW